jgi:hypothetical protein
VAQSDRVFFDAFGLFLIHYPPVIGWVLLGAALIAWGLAARRGGGARDMWRGAAVTIGITVLAGLLTFILNFASGADGPVNYYDRLAAIPRLQLQALFACITSVALIRALFVQDRPSLAGAFGAAIPVLLLAAFAQAAAPTAAFLIIVPALLGGLVALLVDRDAVANAVATVLAAIGIGHQLTIGYLLLQAVGPDTPMVAALPLMLISVIAWPLAPNVTRTFALFVAQVTLAAAVLIAVWVRFDAVPPSVATYSQFGKPH